MIRATIFCAVVSTAFPVLAGGPPDPDWPCIQRRQPELSVVQVWSGPLPDDASTAMTKNPDVQKLSQIIVLRRTPLDEADKLIGEFAETADAQKLTALFQASFDHIQKTRSKVMAGITRYAHKQKSLDEAIKEKRHEFYALNSTEPKDYDAIDKAEEDLEWSTRIFQDRQQALTYVCETPVILEQRIFSLGRSIAGHLKK